jgi:two-component system chemotaxis response regulator CheB
MAIEQGRIYIAPPDRHMVVERGHIHLSRGPKENFTRPAINPLFRSAAVAYGPETVGVILSGSLDDGAAGLWEIKRLGGVAVVQDPTEASYPSMPQSALKAVQVDYCVGVAAMPSLFTRLATESAGQHACALEAVRAVPALDVSVENWKDPT